MKLFWSKVQGTPLCELKNALSSAAKLVRQVTIEDLVATKTEQSTGLYFFFEGDTLMYVGKSSSRAFIERVPSHFDVRPGSWFGTLLIKLAEPVPGCQPAECLERALNMRLALLVADSNIMDIGDVKDLLRSIEYSLRVVLRPELNAPSNPKLIDPNTPLADIT